MLVVLVWVVATVGVTYVANAAVELVDLQVFPQGARIEVLARAEPTPTTLPRMRATTAPPVASTTVAAPATTVAVPTTTVVAPTTTGVAPTTTGVAPVVTTTTVVVATTVAPTTTVAVAATTTRPPATTTTAPPVAATTTRPPATTTTAPLKALSMADSALEDGRTGSAYRTRLVMDGSTPIVWSVKSGVLPGGLSLTAEGYLEGTPTESGRYVFTTSSVDGSGRTGTAEYSIVVREYRIVVARGGSVTVIVQGNSVAFFSALQAEGFDQAVLVRGGPIVVEVQFLPGGGDDTSWVRCEASDGVVCVHG